MGFHFKLFLITILLIISNISFIFENTGAENKIELKGKKLRKLDYYEIFSNPMAEWDKNYEKTISAIKKHEGFAGGKPYLCPAGYGTIGYGHVINEGETFTELTEKQADSLLRADFNRALLAVESSVKLDGNKKLAIAHFVFAKGIGTFNRSELREKILSGKSIDDELLKHCYYINLDGKRVKSQHALNIRKWELKMFNLDS